MAICSVCSATFTRPKYSKRATCSKACRYRLVSQLHKAAGIIPPGVDPEIQRQRITGANAPWWKGGRTHTQKGYVLVIAPKDWPWPEMVTKSGRIREHRMIMARHLDRPLSRQEVIHHRNGDRTDNRIENLELFESHSAHMLTEHGAK